MTRTLEQQLSALAWATRTNAVVRKTKVGCAIVGIDNKLYSGCNIEHDFCKSIHAEVCALSSMAKSGCKTFTYLLIVAEMTKFTPCGDCLDWLTMFGDKEQSFVGFQPTPEVEISWFQLNILTPHYPIK